MQENKHTKNSLIIIFSLYIVFFILWLWCYIATVFKNPGYLDSYFISKGYLDEILQNHIPSLYSHSHICPQCNLPSPCRAHHCSKCGKCTLRFDHHCRYLGCCIGLYNTKSFILMLFYSTILLGLFSGSYFSRKNSDVGSVPLIFSFGLLFFGLTYFIKVALNTTWYESFTQSTNPAFNRGFIENCKEVFGDNFLTIFLPIPPKTDGFKWEFISPYHHSVSNDNENSINSSVKPDDDTSELL